MLRHALMSMLLLGALTATAAAQDDAIPQAQVSMIAGGNAANFRAPIPPGGIVAIFNQGSRPLADNIYSSNLQPLATNLAGTQVFVEGTAVGLLFVSPQQINFVLPTLPAGTTRVNVDVVTRGEPRGFGVLNVGPNPGIFTSNSRGSGAVAAVATTDGITYDATVTSDGTPIPVPVEKNGRPNFLILYGTGFHSTMVTVTINGVAVPVTFVGVAPGYSGLTQVNVRLVPELKGAGNESAVPVAVSVGGVSTQQTLTIVIAK